MKKIISDFLVPARKNALIGIPINSKYILSRFHCSEENSVIALNVRMDSGAEIKNIR